MIKPGQLLELNIHGLGHAGEGVGRHENVAVFVPGALPGEKVLIKITQVKKSFARGQLQEVLEPSTERTAPTCPASDKCGGCQLQHLNYPAQLEHKRSLVATALTRLGGLNDVEVLPTLGMQEPWHYRNKIHLQVIKEGRRVKLGFFAEGSYELAAGLAHQTCLLVDQHINQVTATLEELINKHGIPPYHWQTKSGLLRHIIIRRGFKTGEIMVVLVTSQEKWPAAKQFARAITSSHPEVVSVIQNINTSPERIVLGTESHLLAGRDYIIDILNGLKFKISAASFYQINPLQTEVLYNKVLELADLKGHETVVDAYCGIGAIANFLARHTAQVIGMEVVPQAVEDAKENARINNLFNTKFAVGPVEKLLPQMVAEDLKPDLIVLDPPRKGCDKEVLQAIAEMKVPKIIYVSCDPATLARDLGILDSMGYETKLAQPVDMFPWTAHVECIIQIKRAESRMK
ncbi:MAG: 23S rRNA (uracil(1939)-C(5))-methyltransferase RlmD [Bacillota bacterium]